MKKKTPEQLRAMWAAIPGVCFDPPKPQQAQVEPQPKTKTGKPRKYAIGHPGQKWYSTKEAAELLQISRITLSCYAKLGNFTVEKRMLKDKNGRLLPASNFYLKEEIRAFHKGRQENKR